MALLHMDGFDGYASVSDLSLVYTGSAMNFSATAGRFGGGAWQFGDVGQLFSPGPFPLDTWTGFALRIDDTHSTDCCLMTWWGPGGSAEASVSYHPVTGALKIWKGNQSAMVGSATAAINDNAWHWWDIHYKNDASSGAFEVWVDGSQLINFTGNTQWNGGVTQLASVVLGSVTVNTPRGYLDDWVITDTTGATNNGRVGDSRIETLRPNFDAGPNNGAPSAGANHYGVVADTTWNPSDYLTLANVSGQTELFGFNGLSSTPASIGAVKVLHYSQKTDTGDAYLKTIAKSAGTQLDGAASALPTAWARFGTVFEQDPHTNASWTSSGVNAIQAGVKVP